MIQIIDCWFNAHVGYLRRVAEFLSTADGPVFLDPWQAQILGDWMVTRYWRQQSRADKYTNLLQIKWSRMGQPERPWSIA